MSNRFLRRHRHSVINVGKSHSKTGSFIYFALLSHFITEKAFNFVINCFKKKFFIAICMKCAI